MRVVVVDLLCNSPYYCGEFTGALVGAGVDAELASPLFYLEPAFLDRYPRAVWMRDLAIHTARHRLTRLTARALEGPLNYARLLSRVRAGRYDVVHVQWIPLEDRASPFMPLLRRACERSGTLLVVTVHDAMHYDRATLNRPSFRRNLDHANLIIALTDHVAQDLVKGVRTTRPVAVIPHGPLFATQDLPPTHVALERLHHPSQPIVLFLGLIKEYKGIDLLSEAWGDVRRSFPTATLLVVGKVHGETAAREVDALRGREGVRVVDRYVAVDEMLAFHVAADVVVFPYRRISQSGAVMTAVGLGRPVVVTPIEGLTQQVAHLQSAVVARGVDGPSIAAALIESLGRRGELRMAAARDRAAIAESAVGWPAVARATTDAYVSSRVQRMRRRTRTR